MKKARFQSYLDHANPAKESEQQGNYGLAAKQWRSAWIAAPTATQTNWTLHALNIVSKKRLRKGKSN